MDRSARSRITPINMEDNRKNAIEYANTIYLADEKYLVLYTYTQKPDLYLF